MLCCGRDPLRGGKHKRSRVATHQHHLIRAARLQSNRCTSLWDRLLEAGRYHAVRQRPQFYTGRFKAFVHDLACNLIPWIARDEVSKRVHSFWNVQARGPESLLKVDLL